MQSSHDYVLEFEDGTLESVDVAEVVGYTRNGPDDGVTKALLDPTLEIITTSVKPENLRSAAATIGPGALSGPWRPGQQGGGLA